ncbi:hypothetical protein AMTR_s00114p00077660 [Amborella trichopoda]|uniref:Uncharacterized protein n=1 Tax=Amborella trichopoda TaxID=13333 RepID=W1NW48_AMBTC|nr:hypothetical protein AMTR_s00114p00077660 [Amborella trichopoda]
MGHLYIGASTQVVRAPFGVASTPLPTVPEKVHVITSPKDLYKRPLNLINPRLTESMIPSSPTKATRPKYP